MDTSNYKKYIQNLGLVLAVVVFCLGMVFTGMMIGETQARSASESVCAERIATKDQLIEYLTHSTIDSATDKVVNDNKKLKKLK